MNGDNTILIALLGSAGILLLAGIFVSAGAVIVATVPLVMAFIWKKATTTTTEEVEKKQ